MKVRAKFRATSIQHMEGASSKYTKVDLVPVFSNDPNSENKVFWDTTPSGKIEMTALSERVSMFELGKEYYIDFTPAE